MAEQFDPSDGRMVLNSLQKRVDAALVEAMEAPWRCLRAVPRIDGTLYFELQSPGGRRRLDWIDHDKLVFSSKPAQDRVIEIVRQVLVEVLADDDFSLLRFYNRTLTTLSFDDNVVDVLLAGRFTPGRTSWFGYLFQDVFQEENTRFRLTFWGHSEPVGFEVRPAWPPFDQDNLIVKNDLFALYLVEDSRGKGLREQVAHQVERFVGFLLSRAVHPGMRLARASLSDSSLGEDSAPVSTSRWGNPLQWYQFFSDFEIERSNVCSFRFIDPVSWVTHGEAECRLVEPQLHCRSVSYTNVPWEQERTEGLPGSMSVFTNLNEEDAVFGGMPKLEEALGEACKNPLARFVCLNNTCLPKIIGDDVPSAMARFTTESLPVLSLNTDLGSPDSAFHDLIRQTRENINESDAESQGRGLNLIGFPPNRGRREIISTLGEMSIEINVCVLPDLGIHLLENYLRGKTGVVYPYGSWVSIVESVLSDLKLPWQVLPAPYGVKRTLQWFQAVEVAMGAPGALETLTKSRLDGLLDQWSSLKKEAASDALAFVVDETSMERLVTSTRLYGFEILPLLEEMGFQLHLLVRVQNVREEPNLEGVLEALTNPEKVTFSYFTSPEELSDLLGSRSFNAVYSEVFFDSRIADAGKAQFNLSMIEMGFEGAIRSLTRMIKVCKWPFYRSYQSYFPRRRR